MGAMQSVLKAGGALSNRRCDPHSGATEKLETFLEMAGVVLQKVYQWQRRLEHSF